MICPGLPGHQHQQSCQPGIHHHGNQQHFIGNSMLTKPPSYHHILPSIAFYSLSNLYFELYFEDVYLSKWSIDLPILNMLYISTISAFASNEERIFCIFVLNTRILQFLSLSSCWVPAHFFINFQDACLNDRNLEKLSFCSLLMIALCLAGLCT